MRLEVQRPLLGLYSLRVPATEPATDLRKLLATGERPGPRRVNRLIQLAVLGARRCVGEQQPAPNTAVYLSSRGAHVGDTVDLLRRGAQGFPAAPVSFINASGNMAGYYIAADHGLHGGNHSLHSLELAWFQLIQMATLAASADQGILIGAVEECVWPLAEHRQRHGLPADAPMQESADFLWLGPRGATGPLQLDWIEAGQDAQHPPTAAAAGEIGLAGAADCLRWLAQSPAGGLWTEVSPSGAWGRLCISSADSGEETDQGQPGTV